MVENVRFSNIRVSEVQTPIIIDQFYCDHTSCRNQTQAVSISGVHYENIRGTFTVKPVHFACSDNAPCSDISLTNVQLQPQKEQFHMYDPFCWQAYGELYTPTVPPVLCLQNGKPASNRVLSDHDTCWDLVCGVAEFLRVVVTILLTPIAPFDRLACCVYRHMIGCGCGDDRQV